MAFKDIVTADTQVRFIDQNEIQEIIDTLRLDEVIDLQDIPNLDLYMDQVITLFEEKLAHTKRYDEDKLLTKTMINNYVKDRVLMPANKKKYTREHILLMIMLYELKQVLSIGDIKELFNIIVRDEKVDTHKLEIIYEIYLELRKESISLFKSEVKTVNEEIEDKVKNVFVDKFMQLKVESKGDEKGEEKDNERDGSPLEKKVSDVQAGELEEEDEESRKIDEVSKTQDMLTVLLLIQKANYYKKLAEKIIDEKLKK